MSLADLPRLAIDALIDAVKRAQAQVNQLVLGKPQEVRLAFVGLLSDGHILLEGVPEDIDLLSVQNALLKVPGVRSIHDLHVWALSSGKPSMTVHVVRQTEIDAEASILPEIRRCMKANFAITHITVQIESAPCEQTDEEFHFGTEIREVEPQKSDAHPPHSH